MRHQFSLRRRADLLQSLAAEDRRLCRLVTPQAPTEVIDGGCADVRWDATEEIDREGEIVLTRGTNDAQFNLNPIVTMSLLRRRSLWPNRDRARYVAASFQTKAAGRTAGSGTWADPKASFSPTKHAMVEAVDDVERPIAVDANPVRLVERDLQGRAAGAAVALLACAGRRGGKRCSGERLRHCARRRGGPYQNHVRETRQD